MATPLTDAYKISLAAGSLNVPLIHNRQTC